MIFYEEILTITVISISSISVFGFLLAVPFLAISAEKCEYDNYVFYRMFVLKAEGAAVKFNATQNDFKVEYAQCDALNHASKMVDFYESYGLSLPEVREDPFSYRSGENYELNLISTIGNYRVVLASLFDYSKFENSHVYSAWWTLTAKTNLRGRDGSSLRQNSWLYFGVWR